MIALTILGGQVAAAVRNPTMASVAFVTGAAVAVVVAAILSNRWLTRRRRASTSR